MGPGDIVPWVRARFSWTLKWLAKVAADAPRLNRPHIFRYTKDNANVSQLVTPADSS
jgi:hypothetical protein